MNRRFGSLFAPSLTLLMLILIPGCSDDDTTAPPTTGSIVIDAGPETIDTPWSLSGPNGFAETGTGDAAFDNIDTGEYSLTWSAVSGWITPGPATGILVGGKTLTFTGLYELGVQPGSAGHDVWITNVYNSRNDHRLRVGGWGDYYYSMIRFDLAGLPATVTTAVIKLFTWGNDEASNVGMTIHRVTSDWDEAVTWSTQPTTENLGSLTMPVLGEWYAIDVTELYNDWQAGTLPNFGIQLRPTATDHKFNEFYSSDYSDEPHLRPKLIIVP